MQKEEIIRELASAYRYNEPTSLHLAIWDAAIEMAAEKAEVKETELSKCYDEVDKQSILQLKFKK